MFCGSLILCMTVLSYQFFKSVFFVWFCFMFLFGCLFLFFYWHVLALQCCVSFCYTEESISYMYTCIPCHLVLPPSPAPLHLAPLSSHLGHNRALSLASCALQEIPTSCVTHGVVDMSIPIFQLASPSPSLPVQIYIYISVLALKISSSVPFVQITHIIFAVIQDQRGYDDSVSKNKLESQVG